MPRCYSCGQYTKRPHRENDGRAERAYCDLCHAERDWKFQDDTAIRVEAPPLTFLDKVRRFFGV